MSCKYYGKHWAGSSFGLVDTMGNQCGAIRRAYAPCRMEIMGVTPEESMCAIAIAEPGDVTIFSRTGEKCRVRLPRSEWVDATIVISSRNGQSLMLQTEKPVVKVPAAAVHPGLGFVLMPMAHGGRWRDAITGAFCEIEFREETPPGPRQQDSGPPGNASTHS